MSGGWGGGGGGGASPLTTKGDIYVYSSADARLAVGTNGYRLQADSGATEGVAWKPTDIGCRVTHSLDQVIGTGAFTKVAFNTESYDTDTMHDNSTNNTRITFTTAGKYAVGAHIMGETIAAGVLWDCWIKLNDTTYIAGVRGVGGSGARTHIDTIGEYNFAANDYIEVAVFQNSGSNKNVYKGDGTDGNTASPIFWARKVDRAG